MGNFFAGMATAVLLGLGAWFFTRRPPLNESGSFMDLPKMEMESWRDSLHHARARAIESERASLFLAMSARDSLVRELQAEVRKHKKRLERGGSVTVVKTETKVDTVFVGRGFDLGGWASGSVSLSGDSVLLGLRVRNAYTVVTGHEKRGLFSRPVPFVEVASRNPWTETVALGGYRVSLPREKRFGIGPVAGLGVDGRFFFGVGAQWRVWGF